MSLTYEFVIEKRYKHSLFACKMLESARRSNTVVHTHRQAHRCAVCLRIVRAHQIALYRSVATIASSRSLSARLLIAQTSSGD